MTFKGEFESGYELRMISSKQADMIVIFYQKWSSILHCHKMVRPLVVVLSREVRGAYLSQQLSAAVCEAVRLL